MLQGAFLGGIEGLSFLVALASGASEIYKAIKK